MAANYDRILSLHEPEKKSISIMDNLSIVIFSVIVTVSFTLFIVLTAREYNEMAKRPFEGKQNLRSSKDKKLSND